MQTTQGMTKRQNMKAQNMKKVQKLVMTMTLAGLAACSGTPEKPVEVSELVGKPDCLWPGSEKEAPNWVCPEHRNDPGSLLAAASYGPSKADFFFQENMAALRARQQLAEMIVLRYSGRVRNMVEATGSGSAEVVDSYGENLAASLSQHNFHGSRIMARSMAPDGSVWVLVGMDEQLAHKHAEQVASTAFGNRGVQWVQDRADDKFREVQSTLATEGGQ